MELPKPKRGEPIRHVDTQVLPCKRLRPQAYSRYAHTSLVKSWQDTKDNPLGKQLDSIIAEIEVMAREIPGLIRVGNEKAEAERLRREAEQKEAERKRNEERRQKALLKSRDALDEFIAKWAAEQARLRFLDELSARIEALSDGGEKECLRKRLETARQVNRTFEGLELLKKWPTPDEILAANPYWL